MKKLLIISVLTLALGSMSYAHGWHHAEDATYHNEYMHNCYNSRNRGNLMRDNRDYQNLTIQIQEQRLLLKKEMIKENPDFQVVEAINNKIAELQAKRRTMRMKARYEYNKTEQFKQ